MASQSAPHILIVEARFYDDMSDALLAGATAALEAAGATWETITVPGCLEIPPAVAMALDATEDGGTVYDGFIALHCDILRAAAKRTRNEREQS